ncbi:MAG: FHA domain-containing protein, partial [Eubacterium sp.]|nr:FHA domain-containing protein [Eubacterium sp.]
YVQDNQGYYLQNGEQQYYGEQQQYYGEQQQYYGNGGENSAEYGETDTLSPAPTSEPTSEPVPSEGSVMWLGGEYTGYTFPIQPNTEVIIGKDPSQANIVIGKEHATVSRKHVGIRYDSSNGMYILTDYSTNGTYINDGAYTGRLERGAATYIGSGVIASIGNGENSFKLV